MPRQKITQRNDGRYKVKYHDKQFYGKTQTEALRKRDAWIAAEKAGFNHDFETMSFHDYAMRWLDVYKPGLNRSQRQQYVGLIDFASEMIGKATLKDITPTDLQALCNLLSPYSPSYANKFMQLLRGIFRAAVADGALLRNPMDTVKRPKNEKMRGTPGAGAMGAAAGGVHLPGTRLRPVCHGHALCRTAQRRSALPRH